MSELKKYELTKQGKALAEKGGALIRKGVKYPLSKLTDEQAEKLTEGQTTNPYVRKASPTASSVASAKEESKKASQ
jgi:hypothetical protein